jgi:hypothetical protein
MRTPILSLVALLGEVFALLCSPAFGLPAGGNVASSTGALAGLPLQSVTAPIRLLIAGRPAELQVVRGREPADALVKAVSAHWTRHGAPVRRDNEGPWRTVSRVGPLGIDVLQLRDTPQGTSEGYLVVWQVEQGRTALFEPDRPSLARRLVPRSGLILSEVSSNAASRGRTVVAWLPGTVDEADRALLRSAAGLGLEQRREGKTAEGASGDERARFFTRGSEELAFTLHREGAGTALVIHLMETTR